MQNNGRVESKEKKVCDLFKPCCLCVSPKSTLSCYVITQVNEYYYKGTEGTGCISCQAHTSQLAGCSTGGIDTLTG